jgi:hypothetical protein
MSRRDVEPARARGISFGTSLAIVVGMHRWIIMTASLALVACGAHLPPTSPAARPEVARHVYRFDFLVTSGEATAGTYTINLEEGQAGEFHVGRNVPIAPSQARVDVGLKLRTRFQTSGDDVLLHTTTEMSTADEPSTIGKLTTTGDTILVNGKPTLVTSMDDGHKRHQVTVTATRMR